MDCSLASFFDFLWVFGTCISTQTHETYVGLKYHQGSLCIFKPLITSDVIHTRNVRHISATLSAFAAVGEDGRVTTWGDAFLGGDSTGVQDQLVGVREISATSGAFAAMADGHIVT